MCARVPEDTGDPYCLAENFAFVDGVRLDPASSLRRVAARWRVAETSARSLPCLNHQDGCLPDPSPAPRRISMGVAQLMSFFIPSISMA